VNAPSAHSPSPLDDTHRADLTSWVESAQAPDGDFPIQNLPLGCFRTTGWSPRPGVAIGDAILDLVAAREALLLEGVLGSLVDACAADGSLNPLLAAGRSELRALRAIVSRILRADTDEGARAREMRGALLVPMDAAQMLLPARVGDYTDFYASIYHATNVGSMFRPDQPLLPNYKWVPIGYHGRASSLVPSGTAVRRPEGQTRDDAASEPRFGPTRRLDYELEVGLFVGAGNALGAPIPIAEAEQHVAGLCLVNDWSARDIQAWEYQPLGPFLAKNFATTVSPWLVTLDALEPFRAPAFERAEGDPAPLPYLSDPGNQRRGGVDITLEVLISSARMRAEDLAPMRVSLGSFTTMYWTPGQLVTHHASNGCNLQPGDLLASGTVSGPSNESRGCLLERTWRGTEPLTLPTGETRRFLEDADEVIMRGWCERAGFRRIGFGECRGIVNPA
jgi:fumarylacetoacetase